MGDAKITPSSKFLIEVKNRGGKILTPYVSALHHIEVECEKKHKWKAKPADILKEWCDECKKDLINPVVEILSELEVDMETPFILPELETIIFDVMVQIGDTKILYSYDDCDLLENPIKQTKIILEINTTEKLDYRLVRILAQPGDTKESLLNFIETSLTSDKKLILQIEYPFYKPDDGRIKIKKSSSIEYLQVPKDIADKKAVLLYGRVSTVMQLEGFSLESQRIEAERYVAFIGGYLKGVYQDEGISGRKFLEREALQQLLTDVQKGDIVFIKSLSRLSRQLEDILHLKKILEAKGASIYVSDFSLDTSNSIGTLVFHVLASFCQFESDQIGDRVRTVMHDKSVSEKLVSKPKFGWKKGIKKGDPWIIDEKEQKTIEIIRNLKEKDAGLSLRSMCEYLEKRGVECRKCKVWYASRLRDIMIDNGIATNNYKDETS